MTTATLAAPLRIRRTVTDQSIFIVNDRDRIALRAGTTIGEHSSDAETAIRLPQLAPGTDYAVTIEAGQPVAVDCRDALPADAIGGFHYAPGSNAPARAGGDDKPSINPFSCWDAGFRPACLDPRAMALVDGRFWADIYLLGTNHMDAGTSRCGATIADGRSLPQATDGKGKVKKLDFATAQAIYAYHGKRLLTAEEFFAAAYGVKEREALDVEPETTGDLSSDAARFISRYGLFGATGTMWQWGTDGDPDDPRASLFGGSWLLDGRAGSRQAFLGFWPENSSGDIGARGRSDHLTLA